jgi:hypothetical protein
MILVLFLRPGQDPILRGTFEPSDNLLDVYVLEAVISFEMFDVQCYTAQ